VLILRSTLTKSTSKYEGVSWNDERKRWQVEFYFNGKTSKNYFQNESDAINTKNRIFKKMGILSQDPESCEIPNKKTSSYKGVYLHKQSGNWITMVYSKKGQKQKYGGIFIDELDAAKKANQLCEILGIPIKNPEITGAPNNQLKLHAKEKTSQYKGVYWHQKRRTWHVGVRSKDGKLKHGGSFSNELDAAKQVNQLCVQFKIPEKNSGIGKPHHNWQAREKTSQYKGVSWNKKHKKWYVLVCSKDGNKKYGGTFNDELDAAKQVNQICEEWGILEKNPGIGKLPHRIWQAKEKTSKYKGVSWGQKTGKWSVLIHPKGQKYKHGGSFSHELDAAKRVNQLCEEIGLPEKNPGIGNIPHEQWKHSDNQTIGSEDANSVMGPEIVKTKNREKIKNSLKNFIIDDNKKCYFYKNFLK